MSILAHPLPWPRLRPAESAVPSPHGFAELDERVSSGVVGLAIVRAPSASTSAALGAHLARRARTAGSFVIEGRARRGSPLWHDVAWRLGIGPLPSDPVSAADAIARTACVRRATIIATLPSSGTWDRAVAAELATVAGAPQVLLVAYGPDPAEDLRAEIYDVGATLDAAERRRWWAALADAAQTEVASEAIDRLEAWWSNARINPDTRTVALDAASPAERRLLASLALASRAWPLNGLAALGSSEATASTLNRLGALRLAGGWVALDPAWEEPSERLAAKADQATVAEIAHALSEHFPHDAWAQSRAAELLVRAGSMSAADDAQARALACADDSLARRELIARWMLAVATLPAESQFPLRAKTAERALANGEAEEAFRWAQSAAVLAPEDPGVSLLFGRAAVAMGDLVAARVALQRCAHQSVDSASGAVIAAELSEVAYLSGDPDAAASEAKRALGLDACPATTLKARNVLGKLLLANASWDEADAHFAEDAWTAAAARLRAEELRARLNRGIALLSKGLLDEARVIFDGVLSDGERAGDVRAVAFALDNLSVLATLRRDYAQALPLAERTLKLRQRIGDRLATARLLGNLAELRRRLGLIDHAEHAVAFGRRTLGPGMPHALSALFSLQAARNALMRGNTTEARREAYRAVAENGAAGRREYVCEAYCVAARIALEDGDLARAGELIDRERAAAQGVVHPEAALVAAHYARASGAEGDGAALDALAAARASGKHDFIIEAHTLLAELRRGEGALDAARAHLDDAVTLRDRVAATLPDEVRAAFLSRPDSLALSKLQAVLVEPTSPSSEPPPGVAAMPSSQRRPLYSLGREIIGDDPAIRGLLAAVKKVARASSTVLVRGESGTGKELVAEAIHKASDRASGPLVTVNCAALVETLLLSELFGHEKGAFTGAVARRRGRFELAEGGTLFLDEIGDISPRTQVALLRVLQERTFERVGGTTPLRADVRVICATHRDLKGMVERGEFREDLYYRLRGITLEVPPLRARMGDLPRISEHLLARIALERGEAQKALSTDALELLSKHRWAGNVRELENALRAASLFAEGDRITALVLAENVDDLRAVAGGDLTGASRSTPRSVTLRVDDGAVADPPPAEEGDALGAAEEGPLPAAEASATAVAYTQVRTGGTSLPDIKRQIERDCIARALAETKGNITRAATLLGMKRPRLSQLVKQYGLAAVLSEGS
jgi:transcriptional regulator with GAF, ATPase, and Fis domain/tetratricopeptide (TPR) repeat protein